MRAFRYSHVILEGHKLRFICDRGFDDEKAFAFVVGLDEEFVIRLYHNRTLLLGQGAARTERLPEEVVWETPRPIRFEAWFKRQGRWRKCPVTLGRRQVWLPGHERPYRPVVSEVHGINRRWILLTNVSITGEEDEEEAKEIWYNYRRRLVCGKHLPLPPAGGPSLWAWSPSAG